MDRFIIIISLFGLISCKQHDPNSLPKDLDETISYFYNNWTDKQKEDFVNDSLKNAHFTVGRWIRNNWIHGERDTTLVKYFNNLGIYHPDDISSIILTSLYHKLVNKPIDLEGQIKAYKDYWTPIFDCEKKRKKTALDNFIKYNIGDKISILMSVDTSGGERNAILYECPDVEWIFNSKIDLNISCVIKEKYFINDSSNVFLKVLITKLNFPNTLILMENIKVNQITDFPLYGLTIK